VVVSVASLQIFDIRQNRTGAYLTDIPTDRIERRGSRIDAPCMWHREEIHRRQQLLPQGEVLQHQFVMSAECERQSAADQDEQVQHAGSWLAPAQQINSNEFWRASVSSFDWHRGHHR
jgi:hypothetical protein